MNNLNCCEKCIRLTHVLVCLCTYIWFRWFIDGWLFVRLIFLLYRNVHRKIKGENHVFHPVFTKKKCMMSINYKCKLARMTNATLRLSWSNKICILRLIKVYHQTMHFLCILSNYTCVCVSLCIVRLLLFVFAYS